MRPFYFSDSLGLGLGDVVCWFLFSASCLYGTSTSIAVTTVQNLQQRKEEAVANNNKKVFTDNKDSTIETLSAPNSGRLLKFQDTQAKYQITETVLV